MGLLFALPAVSHAQGAASGPFADVPADHWAYQAVDTLQKAGIVIGYPDGTYGGKRAMTRYEFAVAIARLLPLIKQPDLSNYATKDDLAALQTDLENKLAANQQALDALQALVNEFQDELKALGQDVADVRRRLDALEARVAAVEDEQRRVKITGNLDTIFRGDVGTSSGGALPGGHYDFIDANGQSGDPSGSNRIFQTDSVLENFALNIRGRVSDTASANVMIDMGDYIPSLINTSTVSTNVRTGGFGGTFTPFTYVASGTGFANPNTAAVLREAYLDAPVSLGPLGGADLEIGRVPLQLGEFTLREPDADVYTYLYETDSGNVPWDGGKLSFKVGPVNLTGFAGTENNTAYSQLFVGAVGVPGGGAFQERPTGEIVENHGAPVSQGAGVQASIGSATSLQLTGTLEEFGLGTTFAGGSPVDPSSGKSYNKLTVWGGQLNGVLPFGLAGLVKKGGIGVDASFDESLQGGLSTNTGNGFKYEQTTDQLRLQFGPLAVEGGYQYVGPYYTAPGYWGTDGAWTNPTNVRGGIVSGKYDITSRLSLKADGEWYKAAYGGLTSPLQSGDTMDHYKVGIGYGLTSAYAVDLGYEAVLWDLKDNAGTLAAPGKPTESYITFGIGHTFNQNASLKLLYQIVQYNDKGTGFDPSDRNGGVALGQFEVKF
jgi:hypothetical protein